MANKSNNRYKIMTKVNPSNQPLSERAEKIQDKILDMWLNKYFSQKTSCN
jgi:hypothetical protein